MFVGHLAAAFAAKKVEPELPLWVATAASFGIDLIWPLLLLVGIEAVEVSPGDTAFTPLAFESYPWSHSLLTTVAWGGLAGALVFLAWRNVKGAFVAGGLVVSHWVLDLITHRPDLPLWPGGTEVGLGLWNSIMGTLLVEGLLLAGGLAVYLRMTETKDRIGRWALVGLVVLTGAIWASQPWSPPPPDQSAVASVSLVMWILPFWAGWIERHRRMIGSSMR
jgi:membrane-bound metal-dependent hydrolase YbcI (DUF457 family)